MRARINQFLDARWDKILMALTLLLVAGAGLAFGRFRALPVLALPVLVPALLMLVYDYRLLFWLLIASVPLSMHTELPGGLATDLVAEQLMWVMMFVALLLLIGGKVVSPSRRLDPFLLLMLALLFWTFLTSITSEIPVRSFKYLLAKIWYLMACVVMGVMVLRSPGDIRRMIRIYLVSMSLIVAYGFLSHAASGFSLEDSNRVLYPFYFNHVIYAASAALGVPLAWYGLQWYSLKSRNWYLMLGALTLMLLGVAHALARGAWVSILALPVIYLLFRFRLFEKALYAGLVVVVLAVPFLLHNNYYYRFAPNFKKTVYHDSDIGDHLESTFDGTDLSGMERINRWVSAKNMVAERPLTGFGPSTFSQVYKSYGEGSFLTYASQNKEQSTTHNYFLMTFAEQGFVGGLLFLGLCVYMLVLAYRTYWQATHPEHKNLILAVTLSLSTILLHLLLNELVETDKIGVLFWVLLVCIYRLNQWTSAPPPL